MEAQQLDIATPRGVLDALVGHGATLADLHGITLAGLDAVFELACHDLREDRPQAAVDWLAQLVRFAPNDRRYLFTYAMALQILG